MDTVYDRAFLSQVEDENGVMGKVIPLEDFAAELRSNPMARSFRLLTPGCEPSVREGRRGGGAWRDLGEKGWSWGHVRQGYICAGAGGLNSLRVLKLDP